jgi:hypothetical protein
MIQSHTQYLQSLGELLGVTHNQTAEQPVNRLSRSYHGTYCETTHRSLTHRTTFAGKGCTG